MTFLGIFDIPIYRFLNMHRLREMEEGCFYIDRPREFRPNGYIGQEDVERSFDFA